MESHLDRLNDLLARFADASTRPRETYRWSHHHDGMLHQTHVVFSVLIHGNEVGPLEGLVRVVEGLVRGTIQFGGRVTLCIGNPEAAAQNVRFLESDLNRVFGIAGQGDSHEERRARELMPIIDRADLYLDFHQTLKPTKSTFYIFPWGAEAGQWVRALAGAKVWVTRNPGQAFSPGMMCADEYARARGVPGITLELGEKGFSDEAADTAARVMIRAMEILDGLSAGETTLPAEAAKEPAVAFVETSYRQPFSDPRMRLRDGLVNFEPVTKGELLSAPGTPELRATMDGALLFPKYPPREANGAAREPRPGEIYRIVAPVDGDPAVLWA